MNKDKEYYTIEEQINKLKNKGLIVESKHTTAAKYLNDIGYYKLINGYRRPFIELERNKEGEIINKIYYPNTSIDDIYNLYKFDQELKALLFKNISDIETMVKARMSDFISKTYGVTDYLKAENFKPDSTSKHSKQKRFIEIQSEIIKNIADQYGKHQSITWYSGNYGYYPFWVVANILSLGTTSLLYSKMKATDQYAISKTFGIKSKLFENMLMILLLFRNRCAHNEVVYNFKTDWTINQKEIEEVYKTFKIEKNDANGIYKQGTRDVFAVIIIFKLLLDNAHFSEFLAKFNSLLKTLSKKVSEQVYSNIIKAMGIPDNLDALKKLVI